MRVLLIFGLKILGFQSDDSYKSLEMILYSHILISLNGHSEIVIKIWVSTLTFKYILHVHVLQDTDKSVSNYVWLLLSSVLSWLCQSTNLSPEKYLGLQ